MNLLWIHLDCVWVTEVEVGGVARVAGSYLTVVPLSLTTEECLIMARNSGQAQEHLMYAWS